MNKPVMVFLFVLTSVSCSNKESTTAEEVSEMMEYESEPVEEVAEEAAEAVAEKRISKNDSLVLLDLYHSTDGPNWTKKNWDLSSNVKDWDGVFVNDNGRVWNLQLENNGLSGYVPQTLSELEALTSLTLQGNDLSGEIFIDGEYGGTKYHFYQEPKEHDPVVNDSVFYSLMETIPVFSQPHPDSIVRDMGNIVGYSYGAPIELRSDSLSNDNEFIINGFSGTFLPVLFRENSYYIFSGYVTSFPPELNYSEALSLIRGYSEEYGYVVNQNGELELSEMETSHGNYSKDVFEYGIITSESYGWESGSQSTSFSEEYFGLQEMVLKALHSFPPDYTSKFYENNLPVLFTESIEFKPNNWTRISVQYDNGKFTSMSVEIEEGCFEGYFLRLNNGYYEISDEAGC